MNRDDFVRANEPTWQAIEALLDRLDRGERHAHELAELPERYRRCCHHLALARQRHYDAPLETRLNRIALRGYHHLYRARGISWAEVLHFVVAGFPRLVREHAALFWLVTLLFYGSGLAMAAVILERPDAVYALLDAGQLSQFEEMYGEPSKGRGAALDFQMFGFYIFNNIGIAFRTFAAGLLAGIGTLFLVIFNGLYLGAVFAHLVHAGVAQNLLTFVVTHGALELTAIVVAGVAGLRLGGAVVAPGRYTRVEALRRAARPAVQLALGAAVLLLGAAFLEAFWSASPLPPKVKLTVGSVMWLTVAGYLFQGGRGHASG